MSPLTMAAGLSAAAGILADTGETYDSGLAGGLPGGVPGGVCALTAAVQPSQSAKPSSLRAIACLCNISTPSLCRKEISPVHRPRFIAGFVIAGESSFSGERAL